jgi:hypothetical protein
LLRRCARARAVEDRRPHRAIRGVARWINRAPDGLFVYLGIRIALFQAKSW